MKFFSKTLACLFFAILFMGSSARAVEITATLSSREIPEGEVARLTVRVTGEIKGKPTIPAITGLTFDFAGQTTEFEMINLQTSYTNIYFYDVTGNKAGRYTISPIEIKVDGKSIQAQALELNVVAPAGSRPPSNPDADTSAGDDGNGAGTSETLDESEKRQPVFVRLIPSKRVAYVGELVPVQIRAYFHQVNQVHLNSLPTLAGTAFTLAKMDNQPVQQQVVIDGEPYTILTWSTAISAFKEGTYNLTTSFQLTVLQQVRTRGAPSGMFEDDIFDRFFSQMEPRDLNLTSKNLNMTILPLPEQNRPKNFTGAVGNFTFQVWPVKSANIVEGDPITLKLVVRGTGNFDAVQAPQMADETGWTTYKPGAKFYPDNTPGTSGNKEFQQAMIPQSASIKAIPPFEFSYFDPAAARYVVKRTPEIPIKISAAKHTDSSGNPVVDASSRNAGTTGNDLAPNRVERVNYTKFLEPLWMNPWFEAVCLIPLILALVGGVLILRNHKIGSLNVRLSQKRADQALAATLASMDDAAVKHDSRQFLKACRQACQQHLSRRWGLPAHAITSADVIQRMGEAGNGFKHIFEWIDAADYSGQPISESQMKELQELVRHELLEVK